MPAMTKLIHKQMKIILLFRIVNVGVTVPKTNNEMIISATIIPKR